MKIAVLTYNFNNNYGGMLQAYAMLTKLKMLNHEPELLFVSTKASSKRAVLKNLLKKYFFSYLSIKWANNRYAQEIEKNTRYFIDKYITPKTEPIFKKEHFYQISKNNYDAYLVGSDQVWRAKVYTYIDYAFFGFVESNKPVLLSYAASFGVESWEYTATQTLKYKKQLNRFSGISVREDSGVELCKKYFEKQATLVLDPTMLLTPDNYRELVDQEDEPDHQGDILTYILDINEDKQNVIDIAAKELKYRPFKVNVASKNEIEEIADMTYPTVTSWLKGFDNAAFVITDSFHGCVFAILFNKPFIAYGNEARGMARFKSLLKMFGLEDRLIVGSYDVNVAKITKKIDWGSVNLKLNKYRKISHDYLVETLQTKNC